MDYLLGMVFPQCVCACLLFKCILNSLDHFTFFQLWATPLSLFPQNNYSYSIKYHSYFWLNSTFWENIVLVKCLNSFIASCLMKLNYILILCMYMLLLLINAYRSICFSTLQHWERFRILEGKLYVISQKSFTTYFLCVLL